MEKSQAMSEGTIAAGAGRISFGQRSCLYIRTRVQIIDQSQDSLNDGMSANRVWFAAPSVRAYPSVHRVRLETTLLGRNLQLIDNQRRRRSSRHFYPQDPTLVQPPQRECSDSLEYFRPQTPKFSGGVTSIPRFAPVSWSFELDSYQNLSTMVSVAELHPSRISCNDIRAYRMHAMLVRRVFL